MITIEIRKETTVNLRGCSQEALDSLGTLDALKVNGDLSLWRCTGITKLPGGLRVNGDLSLWGCTGITKLPGGLRVNGDLSLSGCTGITKLPEDLQVEGVIYYNSKTGFYGYEHVPGVIPDLLKNKLNKW